MTDNAFKMIEISCKQGMDERSYRVLFNHAIDIRRKDCWFGTGKIKDPPY
jgi:hypothetical protein